MVSVIGLVIPITPVHRREQRTTGTHYEVKNTCHHHRASSALSRSRHPGFPANRACRESYRWKEKLMSSQEQSCAQNPADGVFSQPWRSPTAQSRYDYFLTLTSHAMDEIGEGTKASATPRSNATRHRGHSASLAPSQLSESAFSVPRPNLGTITTQQ